MEDVLPTLPEKPQEPQDADCCGNGCTPCVFDIYESELKIWEKECKRISQGMCDDVRVQNNDPVLLEDEYRRFKIVSIIEDITNVFIYKFEIPASQTLECDLGQHVIIRDYDVQGHPITRQYSVMSPIDTQGYFEILIKLYSDGKMSQLIKKWTVGTLVEMRGPFNGFPYQRTSLENLYLICMGTGITPLVPIISSILNDEEDEVRIKMLFGCSNSKEILLKKQLLEWNNYWNFSVTIALNSECDSNNDLYGVKVYQGSISKSLIEREIASHGRYKVLICGSSNFTQDIDRILKDLAISHESIFKF